MTVQKPNKKATSQPRKKSTPAATGGNNRVAASTKDFTVVHWREMNKAITRLSAKNINAICEVAPSLTPWKPKGGLIKLMRQLMRTATEGAMASKEIDEEDKAGKGEDGESSKNAAD